MGYDRLYFLKKAFAIYPGVAAPVSARFLAPHYRDRRARRGILRALLDAAVGIGFRAWIGPRARAVQRKFGLSDAWRRGAVRIARTRFADPNDIALFRIAKAEELDTYIRRFEDAALNKRINPLGWTAGCVLADKQLFYARCRAAGLPHPETVAMLAAGQLTVEAEPAGRPLVAKPANGEGGGGFRLLGPIADRDELAARLSDVRPSRTVTVIQERIETHPALADLALNALPTARLVTILDEDGVPEVVSATLRFASSPEACVDNMKAGGLLAPIALESGTLGVACKGYGGGDYPVHPVTGAAISGRTLPDWPAVKALAMHAHASAFADYALIGWDIAMTGRGPLLIEGNGKPGVLMPQRAARQGLGEGRYGTLLAHQLAIKS